jgi:tetratricopeptide (TPR) repeat protein
MYSLLISVAAGAAVALAIHLGSSFGWAAAFFPGLVVTSALYVFLTFRVRKQMEAINVEVQAALQARHIEKAIAALQRGFALGPWQFLVEAQLHASIGMLRDVTDDLDAALPALEAGLPRNWLAKLVNRDWTGRAILAAARYRKKNLEGTWPLLEEAVKVAPKEGLAWSLYAWLLEKEGRHDDAIRVIGRGAAAAPNDARLKEVQQALQNGKKLKLGKIYSEQWAQFRLEAMQLPTDPAVARSRRQIFRKR